MENFQESIDESKKRIFKKLHVKSFFGFFYLGLAAIFFSIPFFNSNFFSGGIGEFTEGGQNQIFSFFFGAMYVIHWFYASIYFPTKYLSFQKKNKYQFNRMGDCSSWRASGTSFLIIVFILGDLNGIFQWHHLILILVFIGVNILLMGLTRTENILESASFLIDLKELIPELIKEGDKKHFRKISYSYPKLEDKTPWQMRAIALYVKGEKEKLEFEKNWREKEEKEQIESTAFSKKLKEIIK